MARTQAYAMDFSHRYDTRRTPVPEDLQPEVFNSCSDRWRDMVVGVFVCFIPLTTLESYSCVPSLKFMVFWKTWRLFVSFERDHAPGTCRFVVNLECKVSEFLPGQDLESFAIEQCLVDMLNPDCSPGLSLLPQVRVKFANATVVYSCEIKLPARKLEALLDHDGSFCFQIDLANRPSSAFVEKNPGLRNRLIPYRTVLREQAILRAVARHDQVCFLELQFCNVRKMRRNILKNRPEHDNIKNLLKEDPPDPPSLVGNLVDLSASIIHLPLEVKECVTAKLGFIEMFISDIREEAHLVIDRGLDTLFASLVKL